MVEGKGKKLYCAIMDCDNAKRYPPILAIKFHYPDTRPTEEHVTRSDARDTLPVSAPPSGHLQIKPPFT